MLYLIIKSYLAIFISVGAGSILLFIAGLYFIFKKTDAAPLPIKPVEPPQDLTAISGDSVIATQLDLARAFLETDQKQNAQGILQHILLNGNANEQQEAQRLLNLF